MLPSLIECDRADRIVRDGGRKQIDFRVRRPGLKFPQAFDLARNNQVFIAAQRDAMLRGEPLRSFRNKVHMRTVAQNLAGGANGIARCRSTQPTPPARKVAPSMMRASS